MNTPTRSGPAADPAATASFPDHDPGAAAADTVPGGPIAPPRFEPREAVGAGGMALVYRAHDAALDRDVAVKILRDQFSATGPAAKRFLDEARITGQLQHPGIPPVHQVGTLADGRPYLVMKLIKGRTLADLLADGAADRGRLVAAFEQVCQAVAYAHAHQVIHRDLKPANVMVGAFGEVQVMDWGLAKVLAGADAVTRPPESTELLPGTEIQPMRDASDATRAGSVLGTPAYMPPEQAIGAIDQVDRRSDVFGLGAILCAILTRQPPFIGTDAEVTRQLAARARLADAFARLDASGADPELVALCKRCLSPDKADRPVDAGQVARDVAGLRAAADDRARRAELDRAAVAAEAREQRKRRRVQVALAGAVGLLLAAGAAFAWYADRQAAQQRADAEARNRDEEARLARNADTLDHLLNRTDDALRDGEPDRAAAALEQVDRRLPEGGGEAASDRVARGRADLAMLRELDDIDTFRWDLVESRVPDAKPLAAHWRTAFAKYGLTPGEVPAPAAADRVNGSPIRERLLAALDRWLLAEPTEWVREVLRSADPGEFREAVRDAVAAQDVHAQVRLVVQVEAMRQPPWFAVVLTQTRFPPPDRRRALLEAALRARPRDLLPLMEMGRSYATRQREDVVAGERLGWFRAAVAAHPHRPEAHFGLGAALQDLGDWRRARASYEEVIRLDPTFAPAHTGLGTVLARTGDLDGAVGSFREAIRLRPDSPLAHSGLAGALRERGDPTGAAASFREAIRLEPGVVTTHHALADVLLGTGDLDGALAAYTEAARFGPYPPGVHNNLAWLFATGPDRLRDGRRAIEYATRACELTRWQNPDFIATLAAAHAAVGDFDKAIEHQQKALSSPEYEKARGRAARERLELYRRRRPYYDPALFPRESGPPPREVKGQSFGGRAAGGDAPVRDRDKKRGFPEVKEFCDRSGKPLVHLPAGYGPNDVA